MKRSNDININTKLYWNSVYGDPRKRAEYETQGTYSPDGAVIGDAKVNSTQRFIRTLNEVKDGDKFIDMGCGVGVLTKKVKGTYPNCEVWGTDISDMAMEENARVYPGIKYIHQYIGSQNEVPDNYFDVAFCGEVIEHLDKPEDAFKDANRILKKGGKFIVTTPLKNAIHSDEHIWEYDYGDIERLYIDNGFAKPRFVYLPDLEHLHVIYAISKKI